MLTNISILKRINKGSDRSKAMVSGSFLMIASNVISNLTRVGLISVLTRLYTKEQFGLWATITSATAIMATTDLGIGNALRNKLAALRLQNQAGTDDEAREYFLSVLYFFLLIAVVIAAVLLLLHNAIPYQQIFKTDDKSLQEQGTLVLLAVQSIFLLSIPLGIGSTMFFAYAESAWVAGFSIINGVLALVIISVLAWAGNSVVVTAITFFLLQFFISLAGTLVFMHRRNWHPLRVNLKRGFRRVLSLLSLSLTFAVLQFAGVFVYNATTIVVTAKVGLTESADFNLVQKLYTFLIAVYLSLYNPLWAGFAEAVHKNDWAWAKKTLSKTILITTVLFGAALLVFTFFGDVFMAILGGSRYTGHPIIFFVMGCWALFYCLYSVTVAFLSATAKIGLITVITALMAVVFTNASIFLCAKMGVAGIALWSAFTFFLLTCVAYYHSLYQIRKAQVNSVNPSL
ncbi:lipopolysaccharide biosynthesis protein [Flavisolibacter ginsenosidimutans]|uniref:Oligosaccharide flippase family protein n=1 Tax=Flavisolibacter ginsenosidimutans TaxID=661481 RepID=A0A5B8UKW0_9BACT|nr:hypothetical protein [Flavisolibacter ginsenosidimutans]QEC57327.1 hypothetical protein FSB75_15940 [Flavisolibacter ginsenosidimutans]